MQLLRIYALIVAICFVTTVYGAAVLPLSEVEALKKIGSTLGKSDWDFSVDPCSWNKPPANMDELPNDAVVCNCEFSNQTLCHVEKIYLREQNLQGSLPSEIANLPFLKDIDLTRNYLNGTIPKEWGTTQLVNVSLLGNRISGEIPKELGNISTLRRLVLEYNRLSGVIPLELGNITSIESMYLTSNNLSGELPLELGKLIAMTDFRIGDNNFMGKIPDFIQNWLNLTKLVIQGSGLEGPIPNGIFALTNMTDLRISDIYGTESPFPTISNLKKLKTLILRSCNLIGQLPDIKTKNKMQTLDLNFNKLSGEIPEIYAASETDFIYFTGNLLSGTVPDWVLNLAKYVDLTYNNFNLTETASECVQRDVNLFASNSENLTYETATCLRNLVCPRDLDSLHINCGGDEVRIGGTKYESDINPGGPANFYKGSNWAFSSTGHFLDNKLLVDMFLAKNTSKLSENSSELSKNARITPISLTYYGFCLMNGKYNVKLHFAEIIFTNDKTFSSLGRRIFDVYIQGKNVLKEFNIEKEAGGVGIEIVKDFQAVVTNRTLEIRFHWSGKGTTGIPTRGVYGPLISAISVQLHGGKKGISVGAIVGIVFSVVFLIILILGILWRKGCIGHRSNRYQGTFSQRPLD